MLSAVQTIQPLAIMRCFRSLTGLGNTAVGNAALVSNTTGGENTATGVNALSSNQTGNYNCAYGAFALSFNTTGSENTAIGVSGAPWRSNTDWLAATTRPAAIRRTHEFNTSWRLQYGYRMRCAPNEHTGRINTASGSYALDSNTTGSSNTATGYYALLSNTTGNYNTGSGTWALEENTTGSENTAIGDSALSDNTTGEREHGQRVPARCSATQRGNYNTANGGDGALTATRPGTPTRPAVLKGAVQHYWERQHGQWF